MRRGRGAVFRRGCAAVPHQPPRYIPQESSRVLKSLKTPKGRHATISKNPLQRVSSNTLELVSRGTQRRKPCQGSGEGSVSNSKAKLSTGGVYLARLSWVPKPTVVTCLMKSRGKEPEHSRLRRYTTRKLVFSE
jgi:hypothetical protein